jgi:hypothetical protein
LASYDGFLHAGMVVYLWRGELVARTGAEKCHRELRKDRAEIEAVAGLRRRAEMDRVESACWWSIFDGRRASRRCATLVAARRWEDARRGAQGDAGGQHLTLQAGTGGKCGGRRFAISQASGGGGDSGQQHVAWGQVGYAVVASMLVELLVGCARCCGGRTVCVGVYMANAPRIGVDYRADESARDG